MPSANGDGAARTGIPGLLLKRLDDLGSVLSRRDDAIALIALGSAGIDVEKLDDHSDLDFFVIVEAAAKQKYLDSIDWLEELSPVAFSFANTTDGRKVLFGDRIYAEYAVFTLDELARSFFSSGRIVWQREDAPPGLDLPKQGAGRLQHDTIEHHVNEALSNLYVGLHRRARGERLSATRLIQSYAVDHVIALARHLDHHAALREDAFALERGVERLFNKDALPLSAMLPGYDGNREAAIAILDWLEHRVQVDPLMAAAIRQLAA